MPIGDIVPEIGILVAAVAILLVASFTSQERQWLGAPIAMVALIVAGIFCAMQIGTHRLTFSGVWAIDGASVWARLMILGATAFIVVLSPGWFRTDRRHGEFYAILLLSTLGAMALAGAADLLQLLMAMLLSSVTGYTLAAYHRDWALSVEAGMKYFLIGALANTVLVLGVTLTFGLLGGSGYADIALAIPGRAASPLLMVGIGLIVVALGFKLGAVPAHAWMPDVAEGSPVPAAAFLTIVPKIGAAIALARLINLFPAETFAIRPLVAGLAAVTMTLGNLAALWQDDVRRLVGWSSVSQSGYALMAICVIGPNDTALPSLLFFLLGYAVANLAAFAVIAHLRGRTSIADYYGLARQRPWASLTLTLSFLSLVGIPPLVGFVGKLMLFISTIEAGYAWLAAVAVANTVISLFYYLRVIGPMYFEGEQNEISVLDSWTAGAVIVGAVMVVGFGGAAGLALRVFEAAKLIP